MIGAAQEASMVRRCDMVVTDSGWWLGIQPFLVPFLLSTAVIPCSTVKKLFVTFCWHRLWFQVWLWGGAWYTWGWSRIAVTTEPQEWHLSFETFKSMGIVNKKAHNLQDRGCVSVSVIRIIPFLKLDLQQTCAAGLRVDLAKVISSAPLWKAASNPTKLRSQKSWSCSEKEVVGSL